MRLTAEHMVTFYTVLECCDSVCYVQRDDLDLGECINCKECERPLVMRGLNGLWYYVGEPVFK